MMSGSPHSRPGVSGGALYAAQSLFPGYFALVMATGVVSIACHLLGYRWLALPPVAFAWAGYLTLWTLTIMRLVRYPRRMALDLSSHRRAPGFFTIVAGTCVLGTQDVVIMGWSGTGMALWYVGLVLWTVVMYAFFLAVTIRKHKPPLAEGINGAWLIAAVATQSIVVLRAAINPDSAPAEWVQILCLAFFMIGAMLYMVIIPLIFYRLTFSTLAARDFGPPYWINMGAAAISTLAGALLVARAETWPILGEYLVILKGMTVFFWAAASWWIPCLVSLMVWRYVVCRDAPRYEPSLWAMVFPLGMYTTATYQTSLSLGWPAIMPIADLFIFPALIAWTVTLFGLLFTLYLGMRGEGGDT